MTVKKTGTELQNPAGWQYIASFGPVNARNEAGTHLAIKNESVSFLTLSMRPTNLHTASITYKHPVEEQSATEQIKAFVKK